MTRFGVKPFFVIFATLTWLACPPSAPCTTCSAVEGTYAVTFNNSTSSPDCATLNVSLSPGTLSLSVTDSQLTGSFNAGDFIGSVEPSGQFSIESFFSDGGSNTDDQAFQGQYDAALNDAGADSLFGTYDAEFHRPAEECDLTANFTGVRQ